MRKMAQGEMQCSKKALKEEFDKPLCSQNTETENNGEQLCQSFQSNLLYNSISKLIMTKHITASVCEKDHFLNSTFYYNVNHNACEVHQSITAVPETR